MPWKSQNVAENINEDINKWKTSHVYGLEHNPVKVSMLLRDLQSQCNL